MVILTLLILLAIVIIYSYVTYRIRAMPPEIKPTVPGSAENFRRIHAAEGFTAEAAHKALAGAKFKTMVLKAHEPNP
jgi:hypothetical protein